MRDRDRPGHRDLGRVVGTGRRARDHGADLLALEPAPRAGTEPLPHGIFETDIPRIPGPLAVIFRPRPKGVTPQRNSIAAASVRTQIVGLPTAQRWNSLLCLHQGAPLQSPSAASDPISGHVSLAKGED